MGKEGAFLAADAAADLHNDALVVVGVVGQQEKLQFLLQILTALFGGGKFLLAEFLHVRVGAHQLQRVVHVLPGAQIGPVGRYHRLQLLLLLQICCRLFRVSVKIGLLRTGAQLDIFFFHQFQLIQHRCLQFLHDL